MSKRALFLGLAASLAAAAMIPGVDADTRCVGVGCGGGGVPSLNPTFTGRTTVDRLSVQGTTNEPICLGTLRNVEGTGISWHVSATVKQAEASTTAQCVWAWSNAATALTISQTYSFSYVAIGK